MQSSGRCIGFGFTLYTFVTNFIHRDGGAGILNGQAPTRFALSLIFLGVLLLTPGIVNHASYMKCLRAQRETFIAAGLLPPKEAFPVSLTLVTAVLLVLVGLLASLGIMLRAGPFQ